MKIYATTSSIKKGDLNNKIRDLKEIGFKNIELTGDSYDSKLNLSNIINENKNVNFIFHNYLPLKHNKMMLNLCSLNDNIYNKSIDFYLNNIKLSQKFNLKKYSIHAGYFIDFDSNYAGKRKKYKKINDRNICLERFKKAWNILQNKTHNNLSLYIENNVYSKDDHSNWINHKPFMLIDLEDYYELKKNLNFKILLDVGHLKVSCKTLHLDFNESLKILVNDTDYIHYSENNAEVDENLGHNYSEEIFNKLNSLNLKNKHITLEINIENEDLISIKRKFEKLGRI